jgi:hypothetical protein
VAVTSKQMGDIIDEHLPYEVQMLNFTFAALCTGPNVLGQLPINAFLESFCIHARNLIDFFAEQGTSAKRSAGAKHYIGASWRAFDGKNVKSEPFYGRLNNQIAHITYSREKDPTKKIGGSDITRIKQLLDAEVKRFVDVLPSKWRPIWNASAAKMGLYH